MPQQSPKRAQSLSISWAGDDVLHRRTGRQLDCRTHAVAASVCLPFDAEQKHAFTRRKGLCCCRHAFCMTLDRSGCSPMLHPTKQPSRSSAPCTDSMQPLHTLYLVIAIALVRNSCAVYDDVK